MFDNHFEVFLADTEESKNIHYNIRYQVYCEEMGFENHEDFPEQMEYDEDDKRSVHFIVRSKGGGEWIGAMRLINKLDGQLPIEKSCKINKNIIANDIFETVELSRLCLTKGVRRRMRDIDPPHGIEEVIDRSKETKKVKSIASGLKKNRLIIWGLIHAAAEYCYRTNKQNWYFVATSALAKVLRRGGLSLTNIGEPFQHRGERFPFKMNAVETFHSKVWQNDYKTSYRLFSELEGALSSKYEAVAA